MKACCQCGERWEERTQPGFRATCDACGMFWHCCKNCRFYDVSQPNACTIPNIELVADKTKSNFCEEFLLAERDDAGGAAKQTNDEAKRRFDALFGGH
jgi:hypothetical protein